MLLHRLRHIGWAAAATALVTFGVTSDSTAQTKKAATAANSPFHVILTELHTTHHLLSLANHDYGGHRAKAHAEVGKAIHLLQTHPHHHHHAVKGSGKPAVKEAQQLSDAQMQQAATNMQTILTQLAALQTTPLAHPNVVAAGSALQQAIGHVQMGLKVSPLNR